MPKAFIFSDTHFPHVNEKKLEAAYHALDKISLGRRDIVIQIGDLHDQWSQSKYFKQLNLYTPEEGARLSIAQAKRFWMQTRKLVSRRTRLIQIKGNHDDRAYNITLQKCPEILHMVDFKSPYVFQGVETIHDAHEEFVFDGVAYVHGWMSGGAQGQLPHARYLNMPVIHGHDHQGYVTYRNFKRGKLFEMSTGLLADYDSLPLLYRKTKTTHWVHGYGVCETIRDMHYPQFYTV